MTCLARAFSESSCPWGGKSHSCAFPHSCSPKIFKLSTLKRLCHCTLRGYIFKSFNSPAREARKRCLVDVLNSRTNDDITCSCFLLICDLWQLSKSWVPPGSRKLLTACQVRAVLNALIRKHPSVS